MKFLSTFLLFWSVFSLSYAQGSIPPSFFEGKSVVLVSVDPSARPVFNWQTLADSIHLSLIEAGGDPVGYYELEQVALSEATLEGFAAGLAQRQVANIIFLTRQRNQTQIHISPFSRDAKLIASTSIFGISGKDWKEAGELIANSGKSAQSKNLLTLDVAEFPSFAAGENKVTIQEFLPRNPLNLDVFKLGIPLEGSSAETGMVTYFRYDMLGKSAETILAEQARQKTEIQEIINSVYPHQVEWLTEAKSTQDLIRDRVQFLLVKVEGRQADLMKSMGLAPSEGEAGSQTVVKYYIKLLVRDEFYIGPEWDAHPDWRISLRQFLNNLKK